MINVLGSVAGTTAADVGRRHDRESSSNDREPTASSAGATPGTRAPAIRGAQSGAVSAASVPSAVADGDATAASEVDVPRWGRLALCVLCPAMSRHTLTPALDRAADRPVSAAQPKLFVPDRAQPLRRITSMVRKGSSVRVRQRASTERAAIAALFWFPEAARRAPVSWRGQPRFEIGCPTPPARRRGTAQLPPVTSPMMISGCWLV